MDVLVLIDPLDARGQPRVVPDCRQARPRAVARALAGDGGGWGGADVCGVVERRLAVRDDGALAQAATRRGRGGVTPRPSQPASWVREVATDANLSPRLRRLRARVPCRRPAQCPRTRERPGCDSGPGSRRAQ